MITEDKQNKIKSTLEELVRVTIINPHPFILEIEVKKTLDLIVNIINEKIEDTKPEEDVPTIKKIVNKK